MNNPLYGVSIGSTISAQNSQFEITPVINENISIIPQTQKEEIKSMTGESSFVHTESMNQGTLGISGSYGISGISRVSSSVGGYVGNAKASDEKSITVNYNIQVVNATEVINFDNLTVEDFVNALSGAPRQLIIRALEAFNTMNKAVEESGVSLETILSSGPDKYPKEKEAIQNWLTSVNRFFSNFNDGIVVGVLWGGIGTVSMNMSNKSNSNRWKYGGKGTFEYSGIGSSISVQATYDGGQGTDHASVVVNSQALIMGDCVKKQTDEWFKEVSGKSFAELADVKVLSVAPTMTLPPDYIPSIPPFQKPPETPGLADKIGEIKDGKGLEAFAIASAFDKAREKDPDLSLADFMKQAKENSDLGGLYDLVNQVKNDDIDTLEKEPQPEEKPEKEEEKFVADLKGKSFLAQDQPSESESGLSGFVPLGVWIVNWFDLIPWFSTGNSNDVLSLPGARQMLRKRMMTQDFIALKRLYYFADNGGLSTMGGSWSYLDIGNSFASQLVKLNKVENADQWSSEFLDEIFRGLSPDAQSIYSKWNELGFLRSSDLGLGIMTGGKSMTFELSGSLQPYADQNSALVYYKLKESSFRLSSKNFDSFSTFFKSFPLILPNQDIVAIGLAYSSQQPNGLSFIADFNESTIGVNNGVKYLKLEAHKTQRMLSVTKGRDELRFYPIPFSASEGIRWIGQGISTNLSAMGQLQQQLDRVGDELEDLSSWSFSGSDWKDWRPKDFYQKKKFNTRYLGIIPEKVKPF
ncbi:MAG: hypothetical protein MI784_09355 [Cytophagales bacterium]|nr:hypothetical protein [Cytophagales bacterium]